MYDAIIIGAGPAGGMTAWKLAEKGISVLLVEQKSVVGKPVKCGEGMSRFALESNGVPIEGQYIVKPVNGTKIIAPNNNHYLMREPGFCVDRAALDQWLVAKAVECGAELKLSTHVKKVSKRELWGVETSAGSFSSRTLVAADGAWSRIGRMVGLPGNSRSSKGLQYKFHISSCPDELRDKDWLRFYFGSAFPEGYAWAFDRGEELNVGVCGQGNMAKSLEAFCKRLNIKSSNKKEINAGMIPVGGMNARVSGDAIITVGDAAGLTNPISDGGNHVALYSGRAGADAVASYLEGRTKALEEYGHNLRVSPFNHPLMQKGADAMHALDDEAWNFFAGLAYGKAFADVSKKEMFGAFIKHPKNFLHIRKAATIRKAAKIYRRYGW